MVCWIKEGSTLESPSYARFSVYLTDSWEEHFHLYSVHDAPPGCIDEIRDFTIVSQKDNLLSWNQHSIYLS